jgi:hypothetical protein
VDTTAHVFLDSIRGKRAYALATIDLQEGRLLDARSRLEGILRDHPGDVPSRRMLSTVNSAISDRR